MIYKKSTIDRIAYTVFLLHAIMTYSNVHYGKDLDASISFFICLGVAGVFSCIYEVAYETLTGEPMNILVTFLELLSKKRKAKLVKVTVATASPVQNQFSGQKRALQRQSTTSWSALMVSNVMPTPMISRTSSPSTICSSSKAHK